MKNFIVLLFLMVIGTHVYAQKSYICIDAFSSGRYYPDSFRLTGDVPSTLKSSYNGSEITIGELLNQLSQIGYHVEFVSPSGVSNGGTGFYTGMVYLLSNNSSSPSHIIQTKKADDSEAYEVARYNLQGIPVKENEKGIQIIVYSNFTTKTVIVQ